jgi:hypothetical protein
VCATRRIGAGMIRFLLAVLLLQSPVAAFAERIQRKPPTATEAARLASDQAMSDGMLRVGDVIATDRGFFQFRGYAPDGSPDFSSIPNPFAAPHKR